MPRPKLSTIKLSVEDIASADLVPQNPPSQHEALKRGPKIQVEREQPPRA